MLFFSYKSEIDGYFEKSMIQMFDQHRFLINNTDIWWCLMIFAEPTQLLPPGSGHEGQVAGPADSGALDVIHRMEGHVVKNRKVQQARYCLDMVFQIIF